jgi:hypothetical protein
MFPGYPGWQRGQAGERHRRWPVAFAALLLAAFLLYTPSRGHAFGTINGLGQRAEHERIVRAALACPPGVKSDGSCFEPRSLDQLAGHAGTLGAVGAPDVNEFFTPTAHCDDADFLNVPGYPQSRAAATAELMACVAHLRGDFQQGIDAAAGLFDSNGDLKGDQVDITSDCTFVGSFSGRAKCNAIEGFGAALHGAEDFYSHSNWADESDPSKPISIDNPPGLNLPAPSPILDLAGTSTPAVPLDLTTGYYGGIFGDKCPSTSGRITHGCLNKDLALIDPTSGAASDPKTPRGMVLSNEQKAVTGAIIETRRQWADFRAKLISTYGADLGQRMILAIAQDVPKVDIVFAIDTTGSMFPYISGAISAANDVVDTLSGRGTPAIITDYQVGVVDYKDVDSVLPFFCPPDYDAVTDLPFSSKRSDIVGALGSLAGKVGGGCDIPEDVLSGIERALNFPWRSGVNKAVIVMGDAPGHDPEAHSGLTSASVAAHAAAIDPVHIYPILVGFDPAAHSFMQNLATLTGGQTFDSHTGGGVGGAILAAITAIITTPPSGDTTPPSVTVSLPTPPDGQGGFFNASQVPVTGTVTASDPANVASIDCTDSAGGLTLGSIQGAGTGTASRSLSVTGDGRHDITCTAADGLGNNGAATGSANTGSVSIDATPPVVTCTATPNTLWPPNNKLVDIATSVGISDTGSGPGGFSLSSATSNEPGADTDIQSFTLGTPDLNGQLRAQRNGSDTGRVYTLTYTGADVAGNTATCHATVTVPHDQGKG